MNFVLNCVLEICGVNLMCARVCVSTHLPFCPVCMLAHFATNYITPKQLNEQVNGVNSS